MVYEKNKKERQKLVGDENHKKLDEDNQNYLKKIGRRMWRMICRSSLKIRRLSGRREKKKNEDEN